MAPSTEITASILEQAARWWDIFHDEEPSAADHRDFAAWVARSSERVEAYLEIARLRRGLRSPEIRWPATSVATLIREAKGAPEDPLSLSSSGEAPPAERRRSVPPFGLRFALSVAAVVLIALGSMWIFLASPDSYSTKFGEQRSVLLEDGSRVTLNTSSKIQVELRKDHRLVRLVRGEALFDVAHDAGRPFEVTTQNVVLRALGTRFDVDVRPRGTTVTVVEGRVARVAPTSGAQGPILEAADRLSIDPDGVGIVQHAVNVETALSWTQRKLVFERRPLGEVADEFNRYNRDRIDIRGEALRSQEISGIFQSNDVEVFLAFLSNTPGVHVRVDSSGTHIVTPELEEPSAK